MASKECDSTGCIMSPEVVNKIDEVDMDLRLQSLRTYFKSQPFYSQYSGPLTYLLALRDRPGYWCKS